MNHLRPSIQRLAIAATGVLIASCGGGGSAPAPTLGGVIKGLQPSTTGGETFTLGLSVAGVTQDFSTTQATGNTSFRFTREFAAGQAYAVQVARHPRNQLCSVQQGGTGTLQGPVDNLVIECHTTVLNDTGLAVVADGGRDAEASRLTKLGGGARGFDFTRLNAAGTQAADGTAEWLCTRDNVTGLVWLKQAGVGVAQPAEGQCGASNWRKPSVHELLSIVHAGATGASVDAGYFPATPAAAFLTGEPYLEPSTGTANGVWAVGFDGAGYAGANSVPGSLPVRWVAGTSSLVDGALTCSAGANGFMLQDGRRGLTWMLPNSVLDTNGSGAAAAVAGVNSQRLGGYGDWRLPNRNELDSLIVRSRTSPALNANVVSCLNGRSMTTFWTASPFGTGGAWVVNLDDGSVSAMDRAGSAQVIYVRRAVNQTQ